MVRWSQKDVRRKKILIVIIQPFRIRSHTMPVWKKGEQESCIRGLGNRDRQGRKGGFI